MDDLSIKNPSAAHTYDVAVMHRGERTTVEVDANSMTEAGLMAEQKGYAVIPAFPSNPVPYVDYGLNAAASNPKHELVDAGTRRVIARANHEDDLFMLVKVCKDYRVMLRALQEIAKNDPYNQSSAGTIARHAIAAITATPSQS